MIQSMSYDTLFREYHKVLEENKELKLKCGITDNDVLDEKYEQVAYKEAEKADPSDRQEWIDGFIKGCIYLHRKMEKTLNDL